MRATGKTFRAVLRALADASEGKFVIFVAKNRGDQTALHYMEAMTRCIYDCVFTKMAGPPEIQFRRPRTSELIGSLRFTHLEAFQRDVMEHRYDGLEKHKLKVVFDDCGPDDRLRYFIQERARG